MGNERTGEEERRVQNEQWMMEGAGWGLRGAVYLALTLFSFQGHPGPKGEMVRPQLSCLPLRGGGSAWPSWATVKRRPAKAAQVAAPTVTPQLHTTHPLGPHINTGRRSGQGASPPEK